MGLRRGPGRGGRTVLTKEKAPVGLCPIVTLAKTLEAQLRAAARPSRAGEGKR